MIVLCVEHIYAVTVERSRAFLALIAALAVFAQPLAGTACDCDGHSDTEHTAMADMSDNAAHADDSMSGDADCTHNNVVCECEACIQLPGLISASAGLVPESTASDSSGAYRYVEPLQSPAFRPPIAV